MAKRKNEKIAILDTMSKLIKSYKTYVKQERKRKAKLNNLIHELNFFISFITDIEEDGVSQQLRSLKHKMLEELQK